MTRKPVKPGKVMVVKANISDTYLQSMHEVVSLAGCSAVLLLDTNTKRGEIAAVAGLRCRIGPRSTTWLYYSDRLLHGKRRYISETLGHYPALTIAEARRQASIRAGRHASRDVPGQRVAVKLAQAADEYLDHLRAQAAKRGKPPRWAVNVKSLMKHFEPFLNWPLAQLSDAPADVAHWHRKITKDHGPVVANQAAKVLRAAYRRAARLDRSLPPALPTSAVEFNEEARSQAALAFGKFPEWLAAWEKIESPTRKAFQKINLLAGCRPGELARLKFADVLPRERRFVIRGAKIGDDISVPLSVPIARELRRARDAGEGSEYVFPAREGGHLVKVDADGLPACGMELRRTWRTVAADVGVDELISHFLLGHRPAGISRGYIAKLVLSSGSAMRKAQRDVSRRIERLLHNGNGNGKH